MVSMQTVALIIDILSSIDAYVHTLLYSLKNRITKIAITTSSGRQRIAGSRYCAGIVSKLNLNANANNALNITISASITPIKIALLFPLPII